MPGSQELITTTPGWLFFMTEQEIRRWALVQNPDVAEALNMFVRHVLNCFSGYYGTSFISGNPVSIELRKRIANTMFLTCGSMFFSILIGSGLATFQENDDRGKNSQKIQVFSLITRSTPTFWLGMIVLYVGGFALPEVTGFGFPQFGTVSYEVWVISQSTNLGGISVFGDILFHSCLPLFVLTITGSMFVFTSLDNTLVNKQTGERISKEYANEKSSKFVFYSCLIDVLESLKEWFPVFISILILVEVVFTWRGMGRYIFDSVLRMDVPAIRGSIITLSLIVIIAKFIIDVSLYTIITSQKKLNRVELGYLETNNSECCFIEK
jgi:ABC-type dipeptide/oligopeptide/nickel transport system permease component